MARSVVITGAFGFLGRNVVREFSNRGYEVCGIGHGERSSKELSTSGLDSWCTADITLESLCQNVNIPDILVHCAGSGSVAFSVMNPYLDWAKTVSSTAAVLEYIRLYSPSTRLVYPSSAAVYGLVDKLPISERAPLVPASPYGAHKLMAEELCRSYAKNYGIAISMIRFFSIYGEGLKKQLLWDACTKLAKHEYEFSGTGRELRDWLHVDDAAKLVIQAADQASSRCPVVNGGSGEGLSVRDLLTKLFQSYGTSNKPCFSGTPRPGDPPGYEADIRSVLEWEWSPRVPWRDGIDRYVKWFKGAAK